MRNKTHINANKGLSKTKIRSIEKKFSHEFVASQGTYLKEQLEKYKDIKMIIVRNGEPLKD